MSVSKKQRKLNFVLSLSSLLLMLPALGGLVCQTACAESAKGSGKSAGTAPAKPKPESKSESKTETSAAKLKLLKELCAILNPGKNADATMKATLAEQEKQAPQIIDAMLSQRAPKDISPEKLAQLKKAMIDTRLLAMRRTNELLLESIDMNSLCERIYTEIYDKYFTEAQLKDLIAFYKSSTGKRYTEVQGQIATEAIQLTNRELESKLVDVSKKVMQELEQKAREGAAAAGK
ncbi:MAG: DUF2059 domain-containing protein [Candidatus Obscuribacterales bacterium]|nr:DUF2059 domain-containing protein [Candidatus Obscuribacterales bacterium]